MTQYSVKAIINGEYTETTVEAEHGIEVTGILKEQYNAQTFRLIERHEVREEQPLPTGFTAGEKVFAQGAKDKRATIIALDGNRVQIRRVGCDSLQWISIALVSHR